jgi:sulfate/thiosulfate transport system substrate-binding protein
MKRTTPILVLLAVLAAVASGCGGAADADGGNALSLVAYSTPEVVYDEVIPQFQKTTVGRGIEFRTSFGASGEQSRAVEAGLDADVVSFSTEPDMTRLVDAGLVAGEWDRGPHQGVITTSVVSFVVREGNPKDIRTWDDLLRPGVEVVTPNPFTSGAAKWNLLAALGARDLDYVRELLTEHVEVQPKSGREALQAFAAGTGDVLLSYEYEAITAQKKGEQLEYVTPDDTIRIDINLATTQDAPPAAKAFERYLLSEPAQRRFADWGYRPVNPKVARGRFPDPPGLFTIEKFGGWERVDSEYFDPETGAIARIEEDAGVSTAS